MRFLLPPGPRVNKFGYNADIDTTSDPEDVWDAGAPYAFPTSGAATTIVSASTDDDVAGTGAQKVTVEGLDASGNLVVQEVDMDGTTPVTLGTPLWRVFRAYVSQIGSGATNAGNVDVKHGSTVLCRIGAGNGQSLMAIYTVPADYANGAILYYWWADLQKSVSAAAVVTLWQRQSGGAWRIVERRSATNSKGIEREGWWEFPALTDLRVEVTETTANDIAVGAGFDLVLRA